MNYVIENDIPVPTHRNAAQVRRVVASLQVGQSVFVPISEPSAHLNLHLLRPKRFVCRRQLMADGTKGTRIWRVEEVTA